MARMGQMEIPNAGSRVVDALGKHELMPNNHLEPHKSYMARISCLICPAMQLPET